MTRLWRKQQPIAVVTDALHEPLAFTWRGRQHRTQQITRQWRTDIDWWRVRVWRSNFKLATDTGLLVVIYQDLLTGEWFFQRLYD
ncbi:MAG: hypothetical protein KC425_21090 [Anaerolineales bacterium]|nr:hypothetical protein [Anaerolineales bacterium]